MYLKAFGFTEKPFHITPNPRFIFLSKIHKEAFAHLLYGIQQRVGFMSLTGEIGTGKTTVLRTLLDQLEVAEYQIALIFNPCLTAHELLQALHREFGIKFKEEANLADLHDSLNGFLLQQRAVGKTVVLVVDEAQNLDPKVLEQLRLLSNLETETEKLIQMVLVGQPELDEILKRKDLRQLRQRLAVRYHLAPMDQEDTARYVRHRLRIAGNQNSSLFSPAALSMVYKHSGGTPRLINLLCDRALLVAYSRDAEFVDKAMVQTAWKELQQQGTKPVRLMPVLSGLLAGLVLLAVGIKVLSLVPHPSQVPEINRQQINRPEKPPVAAVEKARDSNAKQVSAARMQQLNQKIVSLTVESSGAQAVAAVAAAWQLPLPAGLPAIDSRYALKRNVQAVGLTTFELLGNINDLLFLDCPAILELTLPNVAGKRFLAAYQFRNNEVFITPKLTETGWVSVAELEQLWFGKILLPYRNFRSIPYVNQPESTGQHITELQELLGRLPGVELSVSNRYDRPTIDVVTRFQRKMKLAPDGRVGDRTLFWLYRQTGYQMPRLKVEDDS